MTSRPGEHPGGRVAPGAGTAAGTDVDVAIDAAVAALFRLQRADGSWQGTLPSSAVSTGSAVIALRVADPDGSAALVRAGASWLRETQNADGGWGDAVSQPSTLNATAIALAALQVVEPRRSAWAVLRARTRIEEFGGLAAVADKQRCTLKAVCEQYLALAGLYDGARIGRMPLELIMLPRRLREKLSFTVPGLVSWGLMQAHTRPSGPVRRAVNRLAEPRALQYLAGIREHEGGHPDRLGGVEESALMSSIVCFGLARAGVAPDIVRAYRDYLHATVRPDGSWPIDRDIEVSVSTYVGQGLLHTGLAADPRLAGTGEWLRGCQRQRPFAPTGCPPGGWGWSIPSGWPDTDDTSGAVTVLAGLGAGAADPQLAAGLAWLRAMQNRDGSWGCFARNAGTSMDAACSVMTSHAVLALHAAGCAAEDGPLARAVRWFARSQGPDGSHGNVWFRGRTAGTARVLDALGTLGLAGTATARRARDWLLANQLPGGGWGDGAGSAPSVEETAWAVIGLVAAGEQDAAAAGVAWLLAHQQAGGRWRPSMVGIYFLGLAYWCDHIADGYALQALARYRTAAANPRAEVGAG